MKSPPSCGLRPRPGDRLLSAWRSWKGAASSPWHRYAPRPAAPCGGHQAERCLIVVDYLQLWAKVAEDLRGNFSVRERVDMLGGLLRELALGLHSPLLALASRNRSAGNYGNGKGSAALDSLKESGDLEYAADVVLFLTEAQEYLATPPARAIELTVAKNRDGDTGKLSLIFRPDLGTMREEARP